MYEWDLWVGALRRATFQPVSAKTGEELAKDLVLVGGGFIPCHPNLLLFSCLCLLPHQARPDMHVVGIQQDLEA